MIKKLSLLVLLACGALAFEGCTNHEIAENKQQSDRQNEYTKYWIQTYGLVDPRQDWCTVSAVTADIAMPQGACSVSVYNHDPAEGGHLIGRTAGSGSLRLDMPEGAARVYARFADQRGRVVTRGYYPIEGAKVALCGEGAEAMRSRAKGDAVAYAHTPSYFDAMIVCEDLGSIGDTDFNDVVLGIKHVSGDDATLTIVPMAAGGTLASNIYFDGTLLGETHDLIKPGTPSSVMLNTNTSSIGSVADLAAIVIPLDDPKYAKWTIADNWGDIAIEIVDKESSMILTRPTEGTAPQLICLGGDWFWPRENVGINVAYTGFPEWSCDAGALTWLGGWLDAQVVKWTVPATNPDEPEDPQDDEMWFKVTTSDGSNYKARINGSATPTELVSGEVYTVTDPWTSCESMFAVYSESQAFILTASGDYVLGYPTVANKITEIEFSDNFDMSAVTSFAHMFDGCSSLTSVNVDAWKAPTGALTDLTAMFHRCGSLRALDLGGWTVDNVTCYFDIFGYCSSLATLNLDGWRIAADANLRRFLGNTSNVAVTCTQAVENALRADDTVGGSGTTYARP